MDYIYEYVLDYLIDEGFADNTTSACYILESMSDEWLEAIVEANRGEREQEKKFRQSEKELPGYSATKDIAMMKSRRRESAFSSGATHPSYKRRTPSSRPGTHGYSASLRDQRKTAHKSARNVTKKRPGTTPEDRASEAIWRKHGMPLNPGRMETIKPGEVRNRRAELIAAGERRRGLRSQAVRALRRALGSAHIDDK